MKGLLARWFNTPKPLLVIAPILLFAQVLAGKVLFWGTASLQFIPWRVLAYQQLENGLIAPLWNPLSGMGAPLLANYQLAWFYPPSWILAIFYAVGDVPLLAWGFSFLVVLHLILAGWGMSSLIKRLGMNPIAQTVGGLGFSLCGYVVARATFFSMVWAYAWLPWMIDQASRIARPNPEESSKKEPLVPMGLIIVIAMQLLSGHAQISWYSLILTGAWVVCWGWRQSGLKGSVKATGRFLLAGLAAACLAAVQLLPTAEYLLQSQRAASYDAYTAMTYSFWPWRLITLLAPDFFGNPGRGDYWGYAAYWEDAIYLGVLPLFMALSTLSKLKTKRRSTPFHGLIGFLWVIVILTFTLALGKNTPVFPFLFKHIPTFDMFQAPARYLLWAAFCLALLSAVGMNSLRRPTGKWLRVVKLAAAGSLALTLGALAGIFFLRDLVEKSSLISVAMFGGWSWGAFNLVIKAPWREEGFDHTQKWYWAAAVWVMLDLCVAGFWLNPVIEANAFERGTASDTPAGRVFLADTDEYLLKFAQFLDFTDLRSQDDFGNIREVWLPNLNLFDQVASTSNFDPLVPERYARWMDQWDFVSQEDQPKVLSFMGVSQMEQVSNHVGRLVDFSTVGEGQRVFWYPCAVAAQDEERAFYQTWSQLIASDTNPCVVIETPLPLGSVAQVEIPQYSVEDFSDRTTEITFIVKSSQDGWVVLADLWYPYWVAEVDGQPTELFPANYLFKGIQVPAGAHQISFKYKPLPFYVGCVLSIFSCVLLSAIGIITYLRGQKHEFKTTQRTTLYRKDHQQS